MTFQPPPPPPPPGGQPPDQPQGQPYGAPPPPPPAGQQWAAQPPPSGAPAHGAFDPKTVNPLDWALLAIGLLVLIFSFFGFYKASVSGTGYTGASKSYSAWHDIIGGGFFGWLAMVLAVLGTAALAISLFSPQIKLPFPARMLALAGFAGGLLSEILAIFIHPKFYHESGSAFGYHYSLDFGHGFSFWISLILLLGGTVVALMRFQATGGTLPGALGKIPNIGGHGPQ